MMSRLCGMCTMKSVLPPLPFGVLCRVVGVLHEVAQFQHTLDLHLTPLAANLRLGKGVSELPCLLFEPPVRLNDVLDLPPRSPSVSPPPCPVSRSFPTGASPIQPQPSHGPSSSRRRSSRSSCVGSPMSWMRGREGVGETLFEVVALANRLCRVPELLFEARLGDL